MTNDEKLMQQALDALLHDGVLIEPEHPRRILVETLRARLAQPEPKKADVFAFLLGEGELDGVDFGDKHPTERGNYWWRKHLRAAIAQPEPTLVLWNVRDNRLASAADDHAHVFAIRQREWQGLTDEEIKDAMLSDPIGGAALMSMMRDGVMVVQVRQAVNRIARAIEAKLKEKNT